LLGAKQESLRVAQPAVSKKEWCAGANKDRCARRSLPIQEI
jgi:hypothetical protein